MTSAIQASRDWSETAGTWFLMREAAPELLAPAVKICAAASELAASALNVAGG